MIKIDDITLDALSATHYYLKMFSNNRSDAFSSDAQALLKVFEKIINLLGAKEENDFNELKFNKMIAKFISLNLEGFINRLNGLNGGLRNQAKIFPSIAKFTYFNLIENSEIALTLKNKLISIFSSNHSHLRVLQEKSEQLAMNTPQVNQRVISVDRGYIYYFPLEYYRNKMRGFSVLQIFSYFAFVNPYTRKQHFKLIQNIKAGGICQFIIHNSKYNMVRVPLDNTEQKLKWTVGVLIQAYINKKKLKNIGSRSLDYIPLNQVHGTQLIEASEIMHYFSKKINHLIFSSNISSLREEILNDIRNDKLIQNEIDYDYRILPSDANFLLSKGKNLNNYLKDLIVSIVYQFIKSGMLINDMSRSTISISSTLRHP